MPTLRLRRSNCVFENVLGRRFALHAETVRSAPARPGRPKDANFCHAPARKRRDGPRCGDRIDRSP